MEWNGIKYFQLIPYWNLSEPLNYQLRAIKNPLETGFLLIVTSPITGSYFSFSVVPLAPVSVMAGAFNGVPVVLWECAAVSCASCFTTTRVSGISWQTLIDWQLLHYCTTYRPFQSADSRCKNGWSERSAWSLYATLLGRENSNPLSSVSQLVSCRSMWCWKE